MSASLKSVTANQIRSDVPKEGEWEDILEAGLEELRQLDRDGSLHLGKLFSNGKFNNYSGGGFTEIYIWGDKDAAWLVPELSWEEIKSTRCIVVCVNESLIEIGEQGEIQLCLLNKKKQWGLLTIRYQRTGECAFATTGCSVTWGVTTKAVICLFEPSRIIRALAFFVQQTHLRRSQLSELSKRSHEAFAELTERLEIRAKNSKDLVPGS